MEKEFSEGKKKDERLLHMAAGCECKFATLELISIRLQVKPFFSGTLEEKTRLACVVSAESLGIMTFQREKKNSNTKSTGKIQNPKYLYISTNYCLLTRNQIKTFVSTQIHKCKRSVNRLFKGYLLNIYIKSEVNIFSGDGYGN